MRLCVRACVRRAWRGVYKSCDVLGGFLEGFGFVWVSIYTLKLYTLLFGGGVFCHICFLSRRSGSSHRRIEYLRSPKMMTSLTPGTRVVLGVIAAMVMFARRVAHFVTVAADAKFL